MDFLDFFENMGLGLAIIVVIVIFISFNFHFKNGDSRIAGRSWKFVHCCCHNRSYCGRDLFYWKVCKRFY